MTVVGKLRRLWFAPFLEKVQAIGEFYWFCKSQLFYRPFFGRIGHGSKLVNPMRLTNVSNIRIGENVLINKHSFLLTLQIDQATFPRLTIDDGCVLGHFNHITCVQEVHIGRRVLTADRVHISDNSHAFNDHHVPIMDQVPVATGKVSIGEGSWLGEGVSVISCKVGRNCVIGANAVVINDVPDYCVAVGVPARVVKRFDPHTGTWNRVPGGESGPGI